MKQRLRYPVFEPSARCTVALFEGTASSCKFLGRVKLQLSTMEDGFDTPKPAHGGDPSA